MGAHSARRKHHDLIGDLQNSLLMGDDQNRTFTVLILKVFKDADQVLEGPEIDARLRLVKHAHL